MSDDFCSFDWVDDVEDYVCTACGRVMPSTWVDGNRVVCSGPTTTDWSVPCWKCNPYSTTDYCEVCGGEGRVTAEKARSILEDGFTLRGIKFAFTGTLSWGTRAEAHVAVMKRGGIAQHDVRRDADYLVVGANGGATKITKANRYGIPIIPESEFVKLL